MADIVTFDPLNLRIIENSVGGDNAIDMAEVYSEWKDWLLADPLNQRYPPAFSVIGGEPTSAGQYAGSFFFLINRWRLRPAELDHQLQINGNFYTYPEQENPIVPTLGGYTVFVPAERSSLAVTIETQVAALTTEQADALQFISDIEGGRWLIDEVAKQMIFYGPDNVTEVARFNLLDKDGIATGTPAEAYERTRA